MKLEASEKIQSDKVVMTLDAGGTNFVFGAMQRGDYIVDEVKLPSMGHDLGACLQQLIKGFTAIKHKLPFAPDAISFAFPGPADFPGGIIGDLVNLPGFRGGVPLGPMLEHHFQVPVFINNDGDLFAYGEAMAGFLPSLNGLLTKHGSKKQYKSLLGVTLGTGFGGGFVHHGTLLTGDNAAAAEVWSVQHPERPDIFAEEGLSIRGVKRIFREFLSEDHIYEPIDIARIARGQLVGNQEAAIETWRSFGNILGATLANIMTIFDASVVIGGGLSAAYDLFIDSALVRLNGNYRSLDGQRIHRMEFRVFDTEDAVTLPLFIHGQHQSIPVPFTDQSVDYDPLKRVAIGVSKLGTSRAISLGAYAYALEKIGR